MSQPDFSEIEGARHPFHLDPEAVKAQYARKSQQKLQSMMDSYDTAQRERARKLRASLSRAIQNPEYLKNWGKKNIPDTPLSDAQIAKGYHTFLKNKPIYQSNPRGEYPLSYAQRKTKREADKAALLNSLRAAYPEAKTDKDLMIYYKQGRNMYNQMLGHGRRKLTDQEKKERAVRSMIHTSRPAAVIKYYDKVQAFDGEDYPEERRITGFKPGDYTQRDPKIRDKATKMFAELTGTLGIMPTYDPKLTSIESAKRIYPEDDYDIRLFDMDEDDLTPGTLIIRKKYGFDDDGNYVILPENEWQIVAVNGYRLQDPSEASNIRRLKDMDYYKNHPTVALRKAEGYTQYIGKNYKKYNQTALTSLKNIIRKHIAIYHPSANAMTITVDNTPINGLEFSYSPIVMNTIIAKTARLYAMFLFANCEIGEFETDSTYQAEIFRKYVRKMKTYPGGITIKPNSTLYKHFLLHPRLELYLLRHSGISSIIDSEVDAYTKGGKSAFDDAQKTIDTLISMAVKSFINYQQDFLDLYLKENQQYAALNSETENILFKFATSNPNNMEIAMSPLSDKPNKDGNIPLFALKGFKYWTGGYLEGVASIPASTSSSSSAAAQEDDSDFLSDDEDEVVAGEKVGRGTTSSSSVASKN